MFLKVREDRMSLFLQTQPIQIFKDAAPEVPTIHCTQGLMADFHNNTMTKAGERSHSIYM